MTKVKLPREVAEAIERERSIGISNAGIFADISDDESTTTLNQYFPAVQTFDVLMQALVIGYEIEKAPEEKVREYYSTLDTTEVWEPKKRDAVKETLNLLGIKIEGVNA